MKTMPGTIEITNFSKNYGEVEAVKDLSLEIASGELFGLIGPDGAGKTTTMRTLCTLLRCEQGYMWVDGHDVRTDVRAIRSLLGYMPQRFSLYPDLSVEQNLRFFADLFAVPADEREKRLQQLYHFSKLEPFKKRLAQALSGGMKQKLALSCTLIHTPRILILDEPTTGVDPVSRREFWEILRQLSDEEVTILVSTPYMDEAELCDRVAFMHRGEALAVDYPKELSKHFPYQLFEATGPDTHGLENFFQSIPEASSIQIFGDRLHVSFDKGWDAAQLDTIKERSPVAIHKLEPIQPSMEDTFLALMKKQEATN